jgi:hypothetical protein
MQTETETLHSLLMATTSMILSEDVINPAPTTRVIFVVEHQVLHFFSHLSIQNLKRSRAAVQHQTKRAREAGASRFFSHPDCVAI